MSGTAYPAQNRPSPEPRYVPEPEAPAFSSPQEPISRTPSSREDQGSTNQTEEPSLPSDLAPAFTEEDLEDGLDALLSPDRGRGEPGDDQDRLSSREDIDDADLSEEQGPVENDWEADNLSDDILMNEQNDDLDLLEGEGLEAAIPQEKRQNNPIDENAEPVLMDAFPENFSDDFNDTPKSESDSDMFQDESTKTKKIIPTADRIAQLMDYLGSLSNYLPPDKKLQLLNDHIPLKIERIKLNLKTGKANLQNKAGEARRKVRELIDKVRGNLK